MREAARQPGALLERPKFWRLKLFELYLDRCDELLFTTPEAGLALAKPAPAYAAKIAEVEPQVSRPALLLNAWAHLGTAYRATSDHDHAESAFREALVYKAQTPAPLVADLYRRLAYLRIYQQDPEAFKLIDEAIAIFKYGNLVDRHELGRCLVCRGQAFFQFKQPGKSLDDLTAALNHLSLRKGPRPYFAALHSLAGWAVHHGSREELENAYDNLKPALSILNAYTRRHFAKYKLRWLIALIEARLGRHGLATLALREVRAGLERLKLPYEVGMVSIDLATLYLDQGQYDLIGPLAEETAMLFRRVGVEPKAQEALQLLHQANSARKLTGDLLSRVRAAFAGCADPMPLVA